jgi:hypothetical protein
MRIPGAVSWLTVLALLFPVAGLPGPGETGNREIAYLLNAIEASECTFLRNDVPYSSRDAADHIRKKYDYLGDRIGSAEEFIELCASRSSMSGTQYMIRCGDSDAVPSSTWLKRRLDEFRRGSAD